MAEPQLVRKLGFVSASALVVSNMIGTGIFATSGYLAGDLGDPAVLLASWVVAGLLALVGAACYSELAVNFPRSGGEYVYLTEAWGPAWGFINGWVSFFAGFSAPIAAAALAVSAYLGYFNPAFDPHSGLAPAWSLGPLSVRFGAAQILACTIVAAFTALNVFGLEPAARTQNALTAIKLTVLTALLLLGFSVGSGDWAHFSMTAERTSAASLPAQFVLSLVFVYWAYSGWNAAVYVAEEIRDPRKTLPRAMLFGTTLVIGFFLALNTLYIYANPLERMKGVTAVGAQAAESLFGEAVGGVFAAAMAFSLLATVNAMCVVGPRVYYAMARNRSFFAAAGEIHPRWKSPYKAVIAQGVCSCLLILTGAFESLGYYIGFTLWLFTAFSVLALLKFRRRPGWTRLRWVSFAYPLIPSLYVATNLFAFFYFVSARGWEALWSLATIASGAAAYHLYIRRGGGSDADAGEARG